MQLTAVELATVLAALRLWQLRVVLPAEKSSIPTKAIASAAPEIFADCQPLNSERIETLCQWLNFEA